MGEILKYSLFTPIRLGKSWLGVIIYGLLLFILYNLLVAVYAYAANSYFGGYAPEGEIGRLLWSGQFVVTHFISEVYGNFLIVLMVLVVFLQTRIKYVLPKDILTAFTARFKGIISLVVFFSILNICFYYLFDYLDYDWLTLLYDHIVWNIMMLLFAIGIYNLLEQGSSIIDCLKNGLKFFNEGNLASIIILYGLFYIAVFIPGWVSEQINEVFLSYTRSIDLTDQSLMNKVMFIGMLLGYPLGFLLLFLDFIMLSIFAGALTKIFSAQTQIKQLP